MPDMMFIIDVRKEDIAIKEANRLNIPIVAVVDTNCSPEGIDHVIPGNDDALRAIRLFASRIADAIIEGRQVGTEGRSADVEPEEISAETATPVVESTISIPKQFLTEDDVAEIENTAEVAEIVEEDVDDVVAESDSTAAQPENTAEIPVAETALEQAEAVEPDSEDGSAEEAKASEESTEATAS